jgi:hypothetical protein
MELDKIPEYERRLEAIRVECLSCCGAEERDGEVKLLIVNNKRWDALKEENATIMNRLRLIYDLVSRLDGLFSAAERAGLVVHRKTPRGARDSEVLWRNHHRTEQDPNPFEPAARSKGIANPDLVKLAEACEAAQAELLGL